MKTNDIRNKFLDYFKNNNHKVCSSSSLIPSNDETLLFTNAGMVQFKDVFLGTEKSKFDRATSSQRCIRAGGKHNDLENVGYTLRHHTFFEMLGNFSFGDYFKEDAIKYAWDFLTNELKLSEEKLWISVFREDNEAEKIWRDVVGVNPERIVKLDEEDNFWSMGDTGPCGPCSEIYFDHGDQFEGTPPGHPGDEGDRYVEIWNLVFMQFNRDLDGTLTPLPKPSVDTGMGLERIAAVMQGVASNYSTDIFQDIISASEALLQNPSSNSHKVIADHIRSVSFLIADGVMPSNEGRGYVLRRILRRAIRHGYKLGARKPFFYSLTKPLITNMGDQYPELKKAEATITENIKIEELKFFETLGKGLKILDEHLQDGKKVISGNIAFKLHDTFGFPIDLTQDIAREKEINVDISEFEIFMSKQQEGSKKGSTFSKVTLDLLNIPETLFDGYASLKTESRVQGIWVDGKAVDSISGDDKALIAFDRTPFYGESGGQTGDKGTIECKTFTGKVIDCQKEGKIFLHSVNITSGFLKIGDEVALIVNDLIRANVAKNHSATHLLHAALKKVLGSHIEQKGSLVNNEKLRFDFSHPKQLTKAEISSIEKLVNGIIIQNEQADTKLMKLDDAKAAGAEAMFGEKYDSEVRVLTLGSGFSMELCGGTHVARSGDIGPFIILSESSASSGVRRIEAITGQAAFDHINQVRDCVNEIQNLMNSSLRDVVNKVAKLQDENKSLKKSSTTNANVNFNESSIEHEGVTAFIGETDSKDLASLRSWIDRKKSQAKSLAVCVAGSQDNLLVLVGVSEDIVKQFQARKILSTLLEPFGGKGGGKDEFAQGTLSVSSRTDFLSTLHNILKETI
jgi:alanyl-tRNA synthetase